MKKLLTIIIYLFILGIYSEPIEEIHTEIVQMNFSGISFSKEQAYRPVLSPNSLKIAYGKKSKLDDFDTTELYYFDLVTKKEFRLVSKEIFGRTAYFNSIEKIQWKNDNDLDVGVYDGDVCIHNYTVKINPLNVAKLTTECGYEKIITLPQTQSFIDILNSKPHFMDEDTSKCYPITNAEVAEHVLNSSSYISDETHFLYQFHVCSYREHIYFYDKIKNFHSILFEPETNISLGRGFFLKDKIIFTVEEMKSRESSIYVYDYKNQRLNAIKLELEYFNTTIYIKDAYSNIDSQSLILINIASDVRQNNLNRILLYRNNRFIEFDLKNILLEEVTISSNKKYLILRYLEDKRNKIELIKISSIFGTHYKK